MVRNAYPIGDGPGLDELCHTFDPAFDHAFRFEHSEEFVRLLIEQMAEMVAEMPSDPLRRNRDDAACQLPGLLYQVVLNYPALKDDAIAAIHQLEHLEYQDNTDVLDSLKQHCVQIANLR